MDERDVLDDAAIIRRSAMVVMYLYVLLEVDVCGLYVGVR